MSEPWSAIRTEPIRSPRVGPRSPAATSAIPTPSMPRSIGVDAVFLACGNVPEQVDHERAVIDEAAHGPEYAGS